MNFSEEGQDSDEEDDFGLIDMGDENVGRRFEDGDPDNTLIDANVFLESLDDIDRLGGKITTLLVLFSDFLSGL